MTAALNLVPRYPQDPYGLAREELLGYDRIIVAFSGGKDSAACVLHLLELGVPKDRIELWHHDIDGREGGNLMDWPCTPSYCKAFADAFGLELYYSWKTYGFEGEMLRENERTKPNKFETPDGDVVQTGGTRGKKSTRRMFPQVSANLSVRWCSAYLKIDVCTAALNNQDRFHNTRTLVVTGERAEESAARAKYKVFEPHRSDRRNGKRVVRHVDHWRPVHQWSETEVWAILEAHDVNPHPCYRLGFARCSCMACIFGNADQWASVQTLDSERFDRLAAYEAEFGKTLKRNVSLPMLAEKGAVYEMDPAVVASAMRRTFSEEILLPPGSWTLPKGAFGDASCGPS